MGLGALAGFAAVENSTLNYRTRSRSAMDQSPRMDLLQLQDEQCPAFRANHRAVFGHAGRGSMALGAGGGGIGAFRRRIGRHDSGQRAAGRFRDRLKGCPAIAADVVVAAVRRAGVEPLRRAAHGTGDFQLTSPHAIWPAGRAGSTPDRALPKPSAPGPRWPSAPAVGRTDAPNRAAPFQRSWRLWMSA